MKPGQLVKLPGSIYIVKIPDLVWIGTKKNSYLLYIERANLIKLPIHFYKDVSPVAGATRFSVDWLSAQKEFQKTNKIRGYKFLHPNGKDYVWLSHYDVEILKNLKYI